MDLATLLRFVLALLVVVALIAALAWVVRRYGVGGRIIPGAGRGRLAVVEMEAVDTRRRLVLVRRDGVEHLLLLSPTRETVVESGIAAAVPPRGRSLAAAGEDT